jgi:hypothetical protein
MTSLKFRFASALLALGLMTSSGSSVEPQGLSDSEFKQLLKQLDVRKQPFASIPWKTNVTEARKEAARQQKPIFFNVNTGNCLGWT